MKIIKAVNHLQIVPRWIILTLDLSIASFAFLCNYALYHQFDFSQIGSAETGTLFICFLGATGLSFGVFKLYRGIVRYTSAMDSIRTLSSVLCTLTILFTLRIILALAHVDLVIPLQFIIQYGLLLFMSLIIYRTSIKVFFQYTRTLKKTKKNVLVYGAGELGIAVKRTFDHDLTSNRVIAGYLDDNAGKINKSIDGIRIYDSANLTSLLCKCDIDEVIIATHGIAPEKKAELISICLEQNVHTLTLPPVNKIMGGELNINQIKKVKIEDLLERSPIKLKNSQVTDQIYGKRILVTGAAGSIGSEIARQISQYEPQMIILCDQAESPLHTLQLDLEEHFKEQVYHTFIADVTNEERMSILFETFKPQIVYHAAAYKHVPMMENHPIEAAHTNVKGTFIVANLAVKHHANKFVFVSTDKAVNPTNVMGATKRIAEIYIQSLNTMLQGEGISDNTKFVTTRFGNVLGSNGSVIPRFREQIEKGGPVTVTHPDITRYFMTIPEACQLVVEAGCMGNGGEIYVFDMGKSVKIVDLAEKMIKLSGFIPYQDIDIRFTGLRPGEKLYEELLNDLENTLPTHHEKILVAKVRENNYDHVVLELHKLFAIVEAQQTLELVRQMKHIVPEFISQNSTFERLDAKSSIAAGE